VSADFKSMLESLLGQKPEISPEYLRELIDEKKRKVGAVILLTRARYSWSQLIWGFP